MEVQMPVHMTTEQERTLRTIQRVTTRSPLFHGYALSGSARELCQADAIWVTFDGVYVLIQPNGDTERDVLEDFMGFEPEDFTDNFIDTAPGYVAGAQRP